LRDRYNKDLEIAAVVAATAANDNNVKYEDGNGDFFSYNMLKTRK
jgi:hypothetical protein